MKRSCACIFLVCGRVGRKLVWGRFQAVSPVFLLLFIVTIYCWLACCFCRLWDKLVRSNAAFPSVSCYDLARQRLALIPTIPTIFEWSSCLHCSPSLVWPPGLAFLGVLADLSMIQFMSLLIGQEWEPTFLTAQPPLTSASTGTATTTSQSLLGPMHLIFCYSPFHVGFRWVNWVDF